MATLRFTGFLAIANIPLIAGSSIGFGGYGDAFNGRVGPWDANSTEFTNAVAASNATGVFKVPGYDVSKPYPGEPIDGWTIRVAAVDLSQVLQSGRGVDYYTSSRVPMIGHSLTIQAPDALLKTNTDGTKVVNTDPSWGMCSWNFGHPNQLTKDRYNNPDNKPLAEDGSCKGFLSDACIAALERATEYSYSVADSAAEAKGRFGSLTTCDSISTPDECGEHGPGNAGSSVPSYGGVPIPYLNGSVTSTDGWEFEGDIGTHYNSTKDLQEFWDSMVVNYWVVVTAMVNATVDPDTPGYERGTGLSRVHCISPNGAGTGKGFTFSGVVPANALNSAGGEGSGSEGNGGNGTNGGDGGSGAGVVSPSRWVVWALLGLPVIFMF